MRRVSLNNLPSLAILSKAVYNISGGVVVPKGASLNDSIRERLLKMGINYVYIEDPRFDDLDIRETLDIATVTKASNALTHVMSQISHAKLPTDVQLDYEELLGVITDIEDDIKADDRAVLSLIDTTGANERILRQINVTALSIAMALKGTGSRRVGDIALGALLCDIGEARVNIDDENSWKKHSIIGLNVLRQSDRISSHVRAIVLQHHERCDGSGFPRQLKEDKIDPLAKMVAVADVYCSQVSGINWPEMVLPNMALEYIMGSSGFEFDSEAVRLCLKCLAPFPEGTTINLSSGESGIVVKVKREVLSRPVVRIIEVDGNQVQEPYDLDLSQQENQSKVVVGVSQG